MKGATDAGAPKAADSLLVPKTVFYENLAHAAVLSDIYTDFQLGEHLLLMGNQGMCEWCAGLIDGRCWKEQDR